MPGADNWRTLQRAATDTREQEVPQHDDMRLEKDTLEAALLQAQAAQDLVVHELPKTTADVSDSGIAFAANEGNMSRHLHKPVPGVDELRVEIDTLKGMISTAHDEQATQIVIITEAKQQIIDELRAKIDTLQHTLLDVHGATAGEISRPFNTPEPDNAGTMADIPILAEQPSQRQAAIEQLCLAGMNVQPACMFAYIGDDGEDHTATRDAAACCDESLQGSQIEADGAVATPGDAPVAHTALDHQDRVDQDTSIYLGGSSSSSGVGTTRTMTPTVREKKGSPAVDSDQAVSNTVATLEMPSSGSLPASQPPVTPARAVAPEHHWQILEHPQLRALFLGTETTAEDLDAILEAARGDDPEFRVGTAFAHFVDLQEGLVFEVLLLNEIKADLANFGWTFQDIDELEAALFEHADPKERAELQRVYRTRHGTSASAAARPPRHAKRSRKSGK